MTRLLIYAIVVAALLATLYGWGRARYRKGVESQKAVTLQWQQAADDWREATAKWQDRQRADALEATRMAREAASAVKALGEQQGQADARHEAATVVFERVAKTPACVEMAKETPCAAFRSY